MPKKQAWVVAVDMGYGHQRAAYPLKDIAYDRIITANSDKIITPREKKSWKRFQRWYEGLSRFSSFPVIGKIVWHIYDYFQSIAPFYPFRDLSRPNAGCLYVEGLIRQGLLNSIVEYSKRKKIPFVSTFFGTSIAAAYANLRDVYCVVTDTDINRAWVPRYPKRDKLFYLTPTERATKRLIAYGVAKEDIFFTGFPLPKENVGRSLEILRKDLGQRLPNLDPKEKFLKEYDEVIKKHLGNHYSTRANHPLTVTFSVGGAGCQKEIGAAILHGLQKEIRSHKIRVNLVAGTVPEIEQYFISHATELNLAKEIGRYVNILCVLDKKSYFMQFNELLHTTDILWTKPSELCFYVALGIPLIIAPPVGSHEILNKKWLVTMGAGIEQDSPFYAGEWLFELLNSGVLAKAAWQGFTCAPKYGTYNIERVIFAKNKKNLKFKY